MVSHERSKALVSLRGKFLNLFCTGITFVVRGIAFLVRNHTKKKKTKTKNSGSKLIPFVLKYYTF